MYKCNNKARSRNHCCRGKAVIIVYTKRVSTILIIQHAKRMRHNIFLSVATLVLSRYFINGPIFGKTFIELKMSVLTFYSNII
jgi:hypothetical protein